MKAIVADVYGQGTLIDKDGVSHPLSGDSWTEADLRDSVVTGDGETAIVRYRDDGLEMEIGPNRTYGIEGSDNADVIDVRGHWENLARRILEALNLDNDGLVISLLNEAASDEGKVPDALEQVFVELAGRSLRDAIKEDMAGIWETVALYFVD